MRRLWVVQVFILIPLVAMGCTSGNFSSPLPNGQAENEYDNYHDVQLLQGRNFPIRRRAKSWKAIKRTNVVVQKYDYSCGAAALATMFRYYFQDDVTEDDVLKETLKTLTPKEIKDRQKNGLSMNDLFKTAKKMGYLATVYRLPVEKIRELPAPMIVRIEKYGYKHFVVLRGAIEDRVFLADPTRGNIRLSIHEFLEQWSGEALILGKKGFGLPKDHPLALKHQSPVQNEYEPARRWLYRVVRGPQAF